MAEHQDKPETNSRNSRDSRDDSRPRRELEAELRRLRAQVDSRDAVLKDIHQLAIEALGDEPGLLLTTSGAIRELARRLEQSEEVLSDERIRVEALREEIVAAWRAGAFGERQLHDCLGMTEEQYEQWLLDGSFGAPRPSEDLGEVPEVADPDEPEQEVETFSPDLRPGESPLSDRAVMVSDPDGDYVKRSDYERLRRDYEEVTDSLQHESDENFGRVERLERALEPFARFAAGHEDDDPSSTVKPSEWGDGGGQWTDYGVGLSKDRIVDWFGPTDFFRALMALKEEPGADRGTGEEHPEPTTGPEALPEGSLAELLQRLEALLSWHPSQRTIDEILGLLRRGR